jgi:adenine-specific DNA glycosylase
MELPVKGKKAAVPVVRGVALVLLRKNSKRKTQNAKPLEAGGRSEWEVLVMRRPMGCVWEGMWEVPVVEGIKKQELRSKKMEGVAGWVREVLGLAVGEVKGCGQVRHGLTHRAMRIEVVRAEVVGGEVMLPSCATAGGKRYEEFRWVPWPLEVRGTLPMARLVEKIAAAAG